MASPLPTLFGRHHTKQLDLDQPDGCDHDQNAYHYRMIEGQMVLKGIALKRGWEGKHYDATKLSCYKAKGDDTLARYLKKESPDDLATVWEQSSKSINSIADHYCTSWNTARRWLRDEGYIDPAGIDLTSPRPAPLGVICATCGTVITGTVFTHGQGPQCYQCVAGTAILNCNATDSAILLNPLGITSSTVTAPVSVELSNYNRSEDDGDLEASPYIIKPDPLIAQLGVAIDIIHAERKARTLALIAPIAANADALAMIKDLFDKGLL